MALVKYNNNSISAVTSAASIPSGAMTLIKTLTASASATLSFVNGSSDVVLDSTYPIYLFNPSSTTFAKYFIATFSNCDSDPSASCQRVGGYFNITSAITAMQFKYSNGNMDAGTIKLYGIKDS